MNSPDGVIGQLWRRIRSNWIVSSVILLSGFLIWLKEVKDATGALSSWLDEEEVTEMAVPADVVPVASMELVKDVASSSKLEPMTVKGSGQVVNYVPERLLDGDHRTAWVDGDEGDGTGEWVRFTFQRPVDCTGLSLWNGYAKDDRYFLNNRLKRFNIRTEAGQISFTAQDDPEQQIFHFPNALRTSWLELHAMSVYPGGDDRDDLALTEVSFQTDRIPGLRTASPTYIVCVGAMAAHQEAKAKVKKLMAMGYKAGHFWIPDFPCMSGKELFTVYLGPFMDQGKATEVMCAYKQAEQAQAFALRLCADAQRDEWRCP